MMKPERIIFYVYASDEAEAATLQAALHDFVSRLYDKGVLVTAERLADVLGRIGESPLITDIFRNG